MAGWIPTPKDSMDFHRETGLELIPYLNTLEDSLHPKNLSSPERLPALVAFVWILQRRINPDLTLDDVYSMDYIEIADVMLRIDPSEIERRAQSIAQRKQSLQEALERGRSGVLERQPSKADRVAELEAELESLKAQVPSI